MIDHLLNKIHLGDCLEFMRELPDKCVDLVLTDPPYGIGAASGAHSNLKGLGNKDWDENIPNSEVFNEIFRVSKNQIIWGGNYFYLPPTRGFLFWNKHPMPPSYACGEYAWTSFDKNAAMWSGRTGDEVSVKDRIHHTQKPNQLMKFCIEYSVLEKGIVLDCFSGSGTTALACHDLGLDFICIEKDPDYHAASVKRLEEHQRQGKLF